MNVVKWHDIKIIEHDNGLWASLTGTSLSIFDGVKEIYHNSKTNITENFDIYMLLERIPNMPEEYFKC